MTFSLETLEMRMQKIVTVFIRDLVSARTIVEGRAGDHHSDQSSAIDDNQLNCLECGKVVVISKGKIVFGVVRCVSL